MEPVVAVVQISVLAVRRLAILRDFDAERLVVLKHPAIDVIEERVVVPEFFELHRAQNESLCHEASGRVGPTVSVAAEFFRDPFVRRQVLVGAPGISGADEIAPYACDLVDAGMAGEDDLGASPAIAVSGLLVLPEMGVGAGLVDVRHIVVAEHGAGKDDGKLATGTVASVRGPTGMALADQAVMVYADLDHVDEQALLVLGLDAIAAGQEDSIGGTLGVPLCVIGHALLRNVKGKEARVTPGALKVFRKFGRFRNACGTVEYRQQIAFQVTGQVDHGVVATIARTEGIRRQRAGDTGDHGDGLHGAVVAFAAHGARVIGISDFFAFAETDAGSQTVAGVHRDGQPLAMFRAIVIHDAGIPGGFLPGGHVEHGAIAAALVNGDFLTAVQLVVSDLVAIAGGGGGGGADQS